MASSGSDYVFEDLVAELQELVGELRELQKRRDCVNSQKQRSDYISYLRKKPKDERSIDDPVTPDTDERMPKRKWESIMFQWRQRLRDAAAGAVSSPESS